ncbi:hypothetical protein N7456_004370 [Penicillium angulare]|uniref:non-specific serine/threonine protein kinase n=1 Tax=Penicillium angulare TaxID=116970 RepID=A0A9W9FWE5_9EURO|nr:hypothetical protein N7456_004370 [Penicillium angulare]
MIPLLRRSLRYIGPPWKPLNLKPSNFIINPAQVIEEERLLDYESSKYYPTQIGEVFQGRYQVIGKMGFGSISTVWLARDMRYGKHSPEINPWHDLNSGLWILLKASSLCHPQNASFMGKYLNDELKMYERVQRGSRMHRGRHAVRQLHDSFHVYRSGKKHQCLVHLPLWENMREFKSRNPINRLTPELMAMLLHRLFLGLDYLHTECAVIHTDIKEANILIGMADDDPIFQQIEEEELLKPSVRKEGEDGNVIYLTRDFENPQNPGLPVLCDFSAAVSGDEPRTEYAQPDIYRSPEVVLQVPWSYKVDIWNVGCMIWDMFQGTPLFSGKDPASQTYRSAVHLAEMIRLLGPPPQDLLARGQLSRKFFSSDGLFCSELPGQDLSLVPMDERESILQGEEKEEFLRMMHRMLQWEPEKRATAKELADDA